MKIKIKIINKKNKNKQCQTTKRNKNATRKIEQEEYLEVRGEEDWRRNGVKDKRA